MTIINGTDGDDILSITSFIVDPTLKEWSSRQAISE